MRERKNVMNYAAIRNEVLTTARNTSLYAACLLQAALDIEAMTAESIRFDDVPFHRQRLKNITDNLKAIKGILTDHRQAVDKLRQYGGKK